MEIIKQKAYNISFKSFLIFFLIIIKEKNGKKKQK